MQLKQNNSGLLSSLFRELPDFKGKRRIGRYLFQSKIRESKDIIVRGKWGCVYKLPNLSESLALDIFVNGVYEEETHAFLLNRIPEHGTFLDLGANIGSISIPLCKKRNDIKCIAVEASPWVFGYLEFNIEENGLQKRICTVNKALSHAEGGKLPFYGPHDQFGKGSLSPVFTDQAIMIDRITIDNLLNELRIGSVGMIKIDIEGFEYFAFKGASQLLQAQDAPDILFEFVDWAEERANLNMGSAQALLKEWGYRLYLLERNKLFPLNEIIKKGGFLLFASKRYSSNQ